MYVILNIYVCYVFILAVYNNIINDNVCLYLFMFIFRSIFVIFLYVFFSLFLLYLSKNMYTQ